VRHLSFMTRDFLALVRRHGVATVFADSDKYPSFADTSGDFVYARLMRTESKHKTGYPPAGIRAWADATRRWARGESVDGLPRIEPAAAKAKPRDVFAFFISGAKERAPGAATALLGELGFTPVPMP
jgi:uncharacterized protein YecE (DUF72 family)